MLKALFLSLTLALAGIAMAQNLVPNPSFEEYTTCPSDISQFDRCVGWENIYGSPDLFNACSTNDTVDVPLNFLGYQHALEGQGYAGVLTAEFFGKEMIQARLDAPLVIGVPVYISMGVSPGGFGIGGMTSPILASSGIGLRFSVDPLPFYTFHGQYNFDTAVVYMTEVLNDTSSWQELSAVYMPDSNYQYVQIGNFFGDDRTLVEVLDPNGDTGLAYSFVDKVCVSQTQGLCSLGNAIEAGVVHDVVPIILSENGLLSIGASEGGGSLLSVSLYDALGRSVGHWQRIDEGLLVHLPSAIVGAGVFILQYLDQSEAAGTVRFVIVEP